MNSPIEGLEVVLPTEDTETPEKQSHAGLSTASGNMHSIRLRRWHDSRGCLLWRVQLQRMPVTYSAISETVITRNTMTSPV